LGLDGSYFNIQSGLFEVLGIEEDLDVALFTNACVETKIADIPLKIPVLTARARKGSYKKLIIY